MDHIRYKYCSCCDTRLDKVPKEGVSHVKDAELVNALNVYKTIILPKKIKSLIIFLYKYNMGIISCFYCLYCIYLIICYINCNAL